MGPWRSWRASYLQASVKDVGPTSTTWTPHTWPKTLPKYLENHVCGNVIIATHWWTLRARKTWISFVTSDPIDTLMEDRIHETVVFEVKIVDMLLHLSPAGLVNQLHLCPLRHPAFPYLLWSPCSPAGGSKHFSIWPCNISLHIWQWNRALSSRWFYYNK